ncbi:hypothetical protein [Brevundimonas naejangsanensis]|uniref:hypothetical protein n=1 Tax=Brevundimonas naejangsanensis TaxID=588932 RepID=UPI0011A3D9AC|nr:hypothetical protein [Brevundimonas naejangsanensis]
MSAELNAHHWVVLPPLPNRSHWISRLRDAAERADYVLHDWDESQDLNAGARMMLLTISADEARRRQPDDSRIAFILDALDITLPDQMDQTERHHAIQAASRSFAASTTLPHERVFGPDRLASGAVRLFPDFEVAPPGASRRQAARWPRLFRCTPVARRSGAARCSPGTRLRPTPKDDPRWT